MAFSDEATSARAVFIPVDLHLEDALTAFAAGRRLTCLKTYPSAASL